METSKAFRKEKIEILKIRNGYPACSVWGCKDVSVNGAP